MLYNICFSGICSAYKFRQKGCTQKNYNNDKKQDKPDYNINKGALITRGPICFVSWAYKSCVQGMIATGVYVDVLLAVNYIINIMLISCTAKIAGRKVRGRRIVGAALLGAVSSLTIFLPYPGLPLSILTKLVISAGIVFAAFRWMSVKAFIRELFLFFAVSFIFAGVMLGLWMLFRPKGMTYFNGVVYFNISPVMLTVTTVAAYLLLEIAHRLGRAGRLKTEIIPAQIFFNGKSVLLMGLVDTGNSLREPFSGIPVMLCSLESVWSVLPSITSKALKNGEFERGGDCGMMLRGVPYSGVGSSGLIPAFRAQRAVVGEGEEKRVIENIYVGIIPGPIGDERYDAILNPDMIGYKESFTHV